MKDLLLNVAPGPQPLHLRMISVASIVGLRP